MLYTVTAKQCRLESPPPLLPGHCEMKVALCTLPPELIRLLEKHQYTHLYTGVPLSVSHTVKVVSRPARSINMKLR